MGVKLVSVGESLEHIQDMATYNGNIDKLNRALFSGRGLENMLNVAHEIFKNPIIICDRSFKMIAGVGHENSGDDLLDAIAVDGYFPEAYIYKLTEYPEIERNIEQSSFPLLVYDPIHPKRYLTQYIKVDGKAIAFMSMSEEKEFSEHDFAAFAHLGNVVTTEMRCLNNRSDLKTEAYEYILSALISGRMTRGIAAKIKQAGLQIGKNRRLFTIRRIRTDIGDYLEFVRSRLGSFLEDCQCIIYNNDIVGLFTAGEKMSGGRMDAGFGEFLKHYGLMCGISNEVLNPEKLRMYYEQARETINIACRSSNERTVVFYSTVHIEHMLEITSEFTELSEFCLPQISEIMEYDRTNDTEYYETLRAYIMNMQNSLRTSRALNIHRNTVDYRVGRIKELFEFDMDDPDEVFAAMLTYRIKDYLDTADGGAL